MIESPRGTHRVHGDLEGVQRLDDLLVLAVRALHGLAVGALLGGLLGDGGDAEGDVRLLVAQQEGVVAQLLGLQEGRGKEQGREAGQAEGQGR